MPIVRNYKPKKKKKKKKKGGCNHRTPEDMKKGKKK